MKRNWNHYSLSEKLFVVELLTGDDDADDEDSADESGPRVFSPVKSWLLLSWESLRSEANESLYDSWWLTFLVNDEEDA